MMRRQICENPKYKNKKMKKDCDPQNEPVDLSRTNVPNVSKYPTNIHTNQIEMSTEDLVILLQIKLNEYLRELDLIKPPIVYVYNPLEYAFGPNEIYIKKYCTTPKKILFVGMNPGPFGMCQTGVPFGDPRWVREWLKIEGEVNKPQVECPNREILGLSSTKKEQSGHRFWSFFSALCGVPENFFKYSFVSNFCPLAFMNADGKNVTPGEFKNLEDRKSLETVCNWYYLNLVRLLSPEFIIPIGGYMESRTKAMCKNSDVKVKVIRMRHPSPRAGHKWEEHAEDFLRTHNLLPYFQNNNNVK